MDSKFYVYVHIAEKNGRVFYVGKGQGRRAYTHQHRTAYWKNIVARDGLFVLVVADNLSEHDAFEIEADLISRLGRKDLKSGELVNLTDGGEGTSNPSAKTRALLSAASRGNKHSLGRVLPEWERKARSISNLGKKRDDEAKANLAKSKLGAKNPNHNPNVYKFAHEDGRVVHCTQNEIKRIMKSDGVKPALLKGVSEIASGKRRQIAGWFLNEAREKITDYGNNALKGKSHPSYCSKVHKYKHASGDEFIGTQYELRTKYDLVPGKVSEITSGKRGSHKGWQCVEVNV